MPGELPRRKHTTEKFYILVRVIMLVIHAATHSIIMDS
jgi:hypothetical protein